MSLLAKLLKGFSNIHFAPKNSDGTYGTPIHLYGSKSINATLEFNTIPISKKGVVKDEVEIFSKGTGTLQILPLTFDERKLLFGNGIEGNTLKFNLGNKPPLGALMFSRKKSDNTLMNYCIYNVRFKQDSLNANTIENGAAQVEYDNLEFSIFAQENGDVFYMSTDTNFFDSVRT